MLFKDKLKDICCKNCEMHKSHDAKDWCLHYYFQSDKSIITCPIMTITKEVKINCINCEEENIINVTLRDISYNNKGCIWQGEINKKCSKCGTLIYMVINQILKENHENN